MDRLQLAKDFPINFFDKVVEESGEVLQAIGKYKRFGPDSSSPYDNDNLTNKETLCIELNDLVVACYDLLDWINAD